MLEVGTQVPDVLPKFFGWLAGMIEQQQCGLVVTPESAVGFADALERLAELTQDERRKMGMRGRALAEREFSREKLAGAWVQLLEETAALT